MKVGHQRQALACVVLGLTAGTSLAAEVIASPPTQLSISDTFEPGDSPAFAPIFGSTSIDAAPAPMTGSALVFNTAGNEDLVYDQVAYSTTENGFVARRVTLGFQLLTVDLLGRNNAFTMLFDTPEIRNLIFRPNGDIDVLNLGTGASGGTIGSFVDGDLVTVLTEIDLVTNRWTVQINGADVYSDVVVSPASFGIGGIRFSHGSPTATDGDPGSFTYLDNLEIIATDFVAVPTPDPVPLPAAVWAMLAGVAALASRARR